MYEAIDAAALAGAAIAIGYGCFFTGVATGGAAIALIAIPCGVGIAGAGTAAYREGRQAILEFKRAYRR